jgi:hypothetical protein
VLEHGIVSLSLLVFVALNQPTILHSLRDSERGVEWRGSSVRPYRLWGGGLRQEQARSTTIHGLKKRARGGVEGE